MVVGASLALIVGSASLATLCYGFFSRSYEPLTRKTPNTLYSATILYVLAGTLLLLLSLAFAALDLIFGEGRLQINSPSVVFGLPLGAPPTPLLVLPIIILLMSISYFTHISTEATSRRQVDMGIYTVIFQANVLVVALLDGLSYGFQYSWQVLLGGGFLFISSTGIIYFFRKEKQKEEREKTPRKVVPGSRRARKIYHERKSSRRAINLGIISAIACGGALYIDGEIGRHYLLGNDASSSVFPPFHFFPLFLFYEALTFLLPSLWACLSLYLQSAATIHEPVSKQLEEIKEAWKEFRKNTRGYLLAATCSAGQFVFSVLALTLPGPRFIPAMILATSPLLTVFLDKNARSAQLKIGEYGLAAFGGLGFFLLMFK